VGPKKQTVQNKDDNVDLAQLASEFRQLTDTGALTRRQAISELSRRYGRPSREIYASLEHSKGALP
jgi:hypothetical protein